MPKNFKKLVRERRDKTGETHQAAQRRVRERRAPPPSSSPEDVDERDAEKEDAARLLRSPTATFMAVWGPGMDASVGDAPRFGHPVVVDAIAGWGELVGTSAFMSLLYAVVAGVTAEGIEHYLARHHRRRRVTALDGLRLTRTNAENAHRLATTARMVGQEPPTTFGDLLRLFVRLGIVKDDAGRYAVAFPPPAPEETLPLSTTQRADVLACRVWDSGSGAIVALRECINAERLGFEPPAWMRAVLEQTGVAGHRVTAWRARQKAACAELELKGIGRTVYSAADACSMPRRTRLALRLLAARCDDAGHVAISVEELTRWAGVGRSALQWLQDLGWLQVMREHSGSRPGTYALVLPVTRSESSTVARP